MIREEEKEGEGKRLEKRVKGRRRLRETRVRRIRGGGGGYSPGGGEGGRRRHTPLLLQLLLL